MKALIICNFAYGAVRPFSSIACENPYQIIESIIKVSGDYDYSFIVNDNHTKDDAEFMYLPPHMVEGGTDVSRLLPYEKRIKSKHVQYINKKTLNVMHDEHIRKLILYYNFKQIGLAGFSASFDIIATALGLVDLKQNVVLHRDAIGDLTQDLKTKALNYLNFLGIKND